MLRSKRLGLVAALLVMVVAGGVQAGMIDYHATHNGSDSPFTTLTDNVPTPWEVYMQPLVSWPVGNARLWFAQPGYRNPSASPLGEILQQNEFRTGRPYWLIWDQLVWVPVPHVLWRQPFMAIAELNEPAGPPPEEVPLIHGPVAMPYFPSLPGTAFGESFDHPHFNDIPMPATAAVWFLLLFLPPFRRPRHRREALTG